MIPKWDMRMLMMAELVSSWSKDPSTQTGAVITDIDHRIVSVGYNGFPKGVADYSERYEDRPLKYKLMVHCERNAILFAERSLKGCILYTYPFMPCAPCAAMVIQSGISHVVSYRNSNPRWAADFKLSTQMFNEAKVSLVLYDL
jgi:dCMP deaminase